MFISELPLDQLNKYQRQIIVPGLGLEGQKKLSNSKILVIGAGGLGSPVLTYLVMAGIRNIRIADFDTVELHNLQRQSLHNEGSVGERKTQSAKVYLESLNKLLKIEEFNEKVTSKNISLAAFNCDLLVDCCDDISTRYIINDYCVLRRLPLVSGSVLRWEGQVFVKGKDSSCYRCMFLEEKENARNCAENGVVGSMCGIIGSVQANEVIKMIISADRRENVVGKGSVIGRESDNDKKRESIRERESVRDNDKKSDKGSENEEESKFITYNGWTNVMHKFSLKTKRCRNCLRGSENKEGSEREKGSENKEGSEREKGSEPEIVKKGSEPEIVKKGSEPEIVKKGSEPEGNRNETVKNEPEGNRKETVNKKEALDKTKKETNSKGSKESEENGKVIYWEDILCNKQTISFPIYDIRDKEAFKLYHYEKALNCSDFEEILRLCTGKGKGEAVKKGKEEGEAVKKGKGKWKETEKESVSGKETEKVNQKEKEKESASAKEMEKQRKDFPFPSFSSFSSPSFSTPSFSTPSFTSNSSAPADSKGIYGKESVYGKESAYGKESVFGNGIYGGIGPSGSSSPFPFGSFSGNSPLPPSPFVPGNSPFPSNSFSTGNSPLSPSPFPTGTTRIVGFSNGHDKNGNDKSNDKNDTDDKKDTDKKDNTKNNKIVAVVCYKGNSSREMVRKLRGMGVNAFSVAGGMEEFAKLCFLGFVKLEGRSECLEGKESERESEWKGGKRKGE